MTADISQQRRFEANRIVRSPHGTQNLVNLSIPVQVHVIVDGLNSMPGVTCTMPGGAFYAFPNIIGTGMDSRTMQNRLLEDAGVATVAGTSFGEFGEGYVRFSYANSTENIQKAMERMKNLLN